MFVPDRATVRARMLTDLHMCQTGFPAVRDDDRPEQHQMSLGIGNHRRVAVGKPGRIVHQKRITPDRLAGLQTSPINSHIVRRPLTASTIPRHNQLPIRQLRYSGRMIVLCVEWKNQP